MHVLPCMMKKQCAAKHGVVPNCKVSDGTPIEGHHINTAVVFRVGGAVTHRVVLGGITTLA